MEDCNGGGGTRVSCDRPVSAEPRQCHGLVTCNRWATFAPPASEIVVVPSELEAAADFDDGAEEVEVARLDAVAQMHDAFPPERERALMLGGARAGVRAQAIVLRPVEQLGQAAFAAGGE